jgi:hypothetical protein
MIFEIPLFSFQIWLQLQCRIELIGDVRELSMEPGKVSLCESDLDRKMPVAFPSTRNRKRLSVFRKLQSCENGRDLFSTMRILPLEESSGPQS